MDMLLRALKLVAVLVGLVYDDDTRHDQEIKSTWDPLQSELKFSWEHKADQLEWQNIHVVDEVVMRELGHGCYLNTLVYGDFMSAGQGITTAKRRCVVYGRRYGITPAGYKQVIIFDNPSLSSYNLTEAALLYCQCQIERFLNGPVIKKKKFFLAKKSEVDHYFHFQNVGMIDNVTAVYKVIHDHVFPPSIVSLFLNPTRVTHDSNTDGNNNNNTV